MKANSQHTLNPFKYLPKGRLSLLEKIWLLAPIAVWFSYQPLVRLGGDASTNFELSITVVYAVVLALCGLPAIWAARSILVKNRAVQVVTAFVAWSGVSVLWSANFTRGVLTFGMMGILYLIFLACLAQPKKLKDLVPALTWLFIASAVVMSFLSLTQLLAGIWLGRGPTLLCAGCTATQFGFPRPNVFTIEPQFFGNLLIAPLLILLHRLLRGGRRRITSASFLVIITALFLTLSRGAIFAFGVSACVMLLYTRASLKRVLVAAGLVLASFVVCLLIQGTAGVLSPSINTSFVGSVEASINQLSLGVVDLQTKTQSPSPSPTPRTSSAQTTTPIIGNSKKAAPNFKGYVEESTNVRAKLAKLAFKSWHSNPTRMIFGVGLGSSGVVLHQEFPAQVNQHEIVQNEYAEILLENGLLGLSLFIAIIIGLFASQKQNRWLWAIPAAYMVQWNFFSGYPNAIHVYLVLTVLFVCFTSTKKLRAYVSLVVDHGKE